MSEHLKTLRSVSESDTDQQPVDFSRVAAAFAGLQRSDESEAVLLDLLGTQRRLRLQRTAYVPHSMPPEDMVKSLAAQKLMQWDANKHRPALRQALDTAQSPILRGLLKKHLSGH